MHDHDHDLPGLRARVAHLEDLEAIRALKARYALYADHAICTPSDAHAAAIAGLFVDDASGDYGPLGSYQGRAELLHAFRNVIPGAAVWSRHHVTNPQIEIDGDRATASFYFIIPALMRGAPAVNTLWGTYEDRLTRTAAGWRFTHVGAVFTAAPPAT